MDGAKAIAQSGNGSGVPPFVCEFVVGVKEIVEPEVSYCVWVRCDALWCGHVFGASREVVNVRGWIASDCPIDVGVKKLGLKVCVARARMRSSPDSARPGML